MKYWADIFIYIFVLRLVFYRIITIKKYQLLFLILAFIPIFLMMALRDPTCYTGDVLHYYVNFYKMRAVSMSKAISDYDSYESGYVILNWLLGRVFSDGQCIVVFEALICTSSMLFFIYRNSDYPFYCLLAYLSFGVFNFQMTGFRQAIAMAICLFSYEFVKKRKIIPFLLFVALASTMHISALFFLFVYILYDMKFTVLHHVALAFVTYLASRYMSTLLTFSAENLNKSQYYTNYAGSLLGGILLILINVIAIGVILYYRKEDKVKNIYVVEMGVFTYILRYTSSVIERFTLYSTQTAVIVYPEAINLEPNKKLRIIEKTLYIALAVYYFFHVLQTAIWGPFHSIFYIGG